MTCVIPSRLVSLHPHQGRPEFLRKRDVPFESFAILCPDVAGRLTWRLDVDRVPAGAEAASDLGSGPNHSGRIDGRTHANHDAFWNQPWLQGREHLFAARTHLLGHDRIVARCWSTLCRLYELFIGFCAFS